MVKIFVFAAIYFFACRWGLSLDFINASATAVWPGTGLALAAILIFGFQIWPGILLGAFLVNAVTSGSIFVSAGIAAGNTLEAVLAAFLVMRFADGRQAFYRMNSVLKFVFFTGVAAALSAIVGVSSLFLGGLAAWESLRAVWLTWWLGDFVSAVILAPFLVVLSLEVFRFRLKWIFQAAFLAGFVYLIGRMVFGGWLPHEWKDPSLTYLTALPIVWMVLQFRQLGAVSASLFMSAIAIYYTLNGMGPYAMSEPNQSLLSLQTFMGVISIGGLVLASIVSEREHAEEKLRLASESLANMKLQQSEERARQLAESNRELEQFAYIASHDLQEPLRKIVAFGDRLKERMADKMGPSERDYFERIQNAAMRMRVLIEDLLNFSRISARESLFEPVSLRLVIQEAIADLDIRIVQAAAKITIGEMPILNGNAAQIRQLFQNLIGNSIKFAKKGVPPHIAIHAEVKSDGPRRFWEITVADNGIGFDEKYLDRIFKPFQRLHGREEYEGTGIGLAICQKIMQRHGGRITAISKPGHGSVFTVIFPSQPVS